MSAKHTVTLRCDHQGCPREYVRRDTSEDRARGEASHTGWEHRPQAGTTDRLDYCPSHSRTAKLERQITTMIMSTPYVAPSEVARTMRKVLKEILPDLESECQRQHKCPSAACPLPAGHAGECKFDLEAARRYPG